MASEHLFVVALLVGLALTSATPRDLIVGSRASGDHLLQREHVEVGASKIGLIVTITKTFEGDRYANITQIRALDQHKNGHGATAKIIAGGTGRTYVTMKFVSERFRAIDFYVELYGR